MKTLFIFLALFAGQMRTLQDKPLVRLHPGQDAIPAEFGGHVVELGNTPQVIQLPKLPPKADAHGLAWTVDVKNEGSTAVTLVGNAQFTVHLGVGRTVSIKSTGAGYLVVQ